MNWLIWGKMFTYFYNKFRPVHRMHYIIQYFHHSAAEHRASTRILYRTLFLASLLISAQVLFTPLASSSIVVRHVFFGLPLPRLPWGFHWSACLVMSSIGLRIVWPSHPHLRFLICTSTVGCFVRFHNSLFVMWSSQKILNIFLRLLLIKTCNLVIYFEFSRSHSRRVRQLSRSY